MKIYKIGELAKLAGVTAVSLRHYQKIGLLKPSDRSQGGYRLYTDNDLERLKFIVNAKISGLALEEISEILKLIDQEKSKGKDVKKIIQNKIADINDQISSLKKIKATLVELDEFCSGEMSIDECPIIHRLKGSK